MSRTYAHTTPGRRSKRLLQNGYYHPESSDVLSLLDVSASENDDTISIDSNNSRLSRTSDQRRVVYRETTPHHPFNQRRRNHSASPLSNRNKINTLQSNDAEVNVSKYSHLHQKYSRHVGTVSSSALHENRLNSQTLRLANSVTGVPSQRTNISHGYGLDVGMEPSQESSRFASGEITSSRNTGNQPNAFIKHKGGFMHNSDGIDDGGFKIPQAKSGTKEKFQEDVSYFSEDNSSSPVEYDSYDTADSAQELPKDRSFFGKLVIFVCYILHYVVSYVAKLLWSIGRSIYENVTRVLLFDIWFFSHRVEIGSIYRTGFKLFHVLLLLFGLAFGVLFLYGTLPQMSDRVLGEIPQSLTVKNNPWSWVTSMMGFTKPEERLSTSIRMQSGNDDFNTLIQGLELSIRELELRVADRHVAMSNEMKVIRSDHQKDMQKFVEDHQKTIESVEALVERSVSLKLASNYDAIEAKFSEVQMQLMQLQMNNTRNIELFKNDLEQWDGSKQTEWKNILSTLSGYENIAASLNKKLEEIHMEHRKLKTYVDGHSGNATYLRGISDDQFIESFLILLQKGTNVNQQGGMKSRYQHLALVFMEWLLKRGFIQETHINNLRKQYNINITRLENQVKHELKKLETDLREEYNSAKSSVTLGTIVSPSTQSDQSELSEATVKRWITEALDVYSADRIAVPDFALESSGGSVVNTRCSETYPHKTAIVSIFGIPIYYNINTPRAVIQPSVMPGECWAFKGSEGFIVISLSSTIYPTSFTLDHIPKAVALHNSIASAPKDFSVFGLDSAYGYDGILLGTFRYEEDGGSIQNFKVDPRYRLQYSFSYIELRISSNWGHPDFTCVYRFRVHGVKA